MQTKMILKPSFFDRLKAILDYYNIDNITTLACDYLGYNSSQKLNRLKKEGTKPSVDIIIDISNKFDNISLDWLLKGEGDMHKSNKAEYKLDRIKESHVDYHNESEELKNAKMRIKLLEEFIDKFFSKLDIKLKE